MPAHLPLPRRLLARADARLHGPSPALPRPLDALCERWARLRPRVRVVLAVVAAAALMAAVAARVAAAEARWGGAPAAVLVASEDLPAGTPDPALEARRLPPAAVPPGAVAEVPDGAVLALALPRGSVLTSAHLDARGPAVGLAAGLRAVPVPIDQGWGIVEGGRVDVWVLGAGDAPAVLVAEGRGVLQVAGEPGGGGPTALLGLAEEEVGPVTHGLALGQVLLTHAPGA